MVRYRSMSERSREYCCIAIAAVTMILGTLTNVVRAEDPVDGAEKRLRMLEEALKQANTKLGPIEKDAAAARIATDASRKELDEARRAVDAANAAKLALADADKRLAAEEKRIAALEAKWKAMSDDKETASEKSKLYRLIEEYRKSLRLVAGEYRAAREKYDKLEAEARRRVEQARDAFLAAMRSLVEKDAAAAEAWQARQQAEEKASEARAEMIEASMKGAPPYLKEVVIRQGAKVVYHARWVHDHTLRIVLYDLIWQFKALLAEHREGLKKLEADWKKYVRKVLDVPGAAWTVGRADRDKILLKMGESLQWELQFDVCEARSKGKPVRSRWTYGILKKTFEIYDLLPRETSGFYIDCLHDIGEPVTLNLAESVGDFMAD